MVKCEIIAWDKTRAVRQEKPWRSSGRSWVASTRDCGRGAVIADLWVFSFALGFKRGRCFHEVSFAFDLMPYSTYSIQQSILLLSSKVGITPPVVNNGAWQCACGLCLQDFSIKSMLPVLDCKWRCAQQSFRFLVTGRFRQRSQAITGNHCPLVAKIRDRYDMLP